MQRPQALFHWERVMRSGPNARPVSAEPGVLVTVASCNGVRESREQWNTEIVRFGVDSLRRIRREAATEQLCPGFGSR